MSKPLDDLLAQLNREVAVERLAEAQGVALERDGARYRGGCPFHEDSGRSLTVDPEANSWACSGPCSGGSAIEWVMAERGIQRRAAVQWLRAEFLMAAGELGNREKLPAPALDPLDPDLDDAGLLTEVMAHYAKALAASPEAQDYLRSRGLALPETISELCLGFADRSLGYRIPGKRWKAGKKLRTQLQALGVLKNTGHETLRGSLVVPVLDAEGQVLDAYGRKIGRKLRAGTALHTSLHEPMRGVWNVTALDQYGEILVAKSITDGLTWWRWSFRNVVVGQPDTVAEAVAEHRIERVVLAFDRGDHGRTIEAATAEVLAAGGVDTFALRFPGEHDANSLACCSEDPQSALAELVRGAEWSGSASPSIPVPASVAAVEEIAATPTAPAEAEPAQQAAPPSERQRPPVIEPPAVAVPDPAPPGPEEDTTDHEVRLRFGDREWRVRGLDRNTRYDTLRVNLRVRREVAEDDLRLDGYHLDTLDLYSAKHRAAYVRVAAAELGLEESIVSRDLGRVLLRLEEIQDDAIQQALEPVNVATAMGEAERDEALALLCAPDLLDRILDDFARCGVVGEDTNKLVGYLAAVSRKLDDPLALLIQSSSAAGKTTLMEAILAFVPEEDRLAFSSITGQAAYYFAGGDLRHKVLAIAEEEGASRASYALKLLASEGKLSIASTGKDAATGRLTSHEYVVEGPISLVVSTSRIDVDPELENRALVLEVSESRELTREIHTMQRERETLAGLLARDEREAVLHRHHNAQRLLRSVAVVNPFAAQLAFPDATTRARRDHRKYLGLIRAVAFLHQHQRPVRRANRGGRVVEYIEVTREDIAIANRLAHAVLGRPLGTVPPQTRRLLGLLVDLVDGIAREQGVPRHDVRFTRRTVRDFTGWGHSQLAVHLRRLEELEFVVVQQGGRGRLRVYELLYTGESADTGAHLPGLVEPDDLVDSCAYGADLPGQKHGFPAPFRGASGPVPGAFRAEFPGETEGSGS